jgi:hypothetical protein
VAYQFLAFNVKFKYANRLSNVAFFGLSSVHSSAAVPMAEVLNETLACYRPSHNHPLTKVRVFMEWLFRCFRMLTDRHSPRSQTAGVTEKSSNEYGMRLDYRTLYSPLDQDMMRRHPVTSANSVQILLSKLAVYTEVCVLKGAL